MNSNLNKNFNFSSSKNINNNLSDNNNNNNSNNSPSLSISKSKSHVVNNLKTTDKNINHSGSKEESVVKILCNIKSNSTTTNITKNISINKVVKRNSIYNSNKRILLVDDVYLVRKNLKKLVSDICKEYKIKCTIECLSDGLETLTTVISDSMEEDSHTKLIISDENMNWINGSVSFKILSNLIMDNKIAKTGLVILTALEEEDVINNLKKESKADYVIKKPANKHQLRPIIDKFLLNDTKSSYIPTK